MRRAAPNPFGTSLVDLLVGALAIVAMLWVLNAPNTGFTGTGEDERTSGSFSVEQYDAAHFRSIRIRHGSWWSATIDIGKNGEKLQLMNGSPVKHVGRAEELDSERSDPMRFVYELPDPSFDEPSTVTVAAASPDGRFRRGLHVVVENLSGPHLEIDFHIEPCCDPKNLHFLETTVRSGNGDRKRMRFWHEAGMLQRALEYTEHHRFSYSGSTSNPKRTMNSIQRLEMQILDNAPLRVHTFHVSSRDRFYTPSDSDVRNCSTLRTASSAPGVLRIRFDPDGDVTVKTRDSNETGGVATSGETEYRSFMSIMDELIKGLPAKIVNNASP